MVIPFQVRELENLLVSLQPTEQKLISLWLAMRPHDGKQYYFSDAELLFLRKHLPHNISALIAQHTPCEITSASCNIHHSDLTRLYGQQVTQTKQTWLNKCSQQSSLIS